MLNKPISFRVLPLFIAIMLLPALLQAQKLPWTDGEKLELDIFWPSGVAMGEATLEAKSAKDNVLLTANVEVALPQGRILYRFSSTTSPELCSREFHQSVERSGKFWEEITRFNSETGTAAVSRDGRTRDVPAGKCARDPLAYLYYYRVQAAAGKKPAGDSLFLTGPLQLRVQAAAKESIKINHVERQAERYQISYPMEEGSGMIELWLDGSPRQTPVAVRVPLPLATFSAELR